MSKTQKTPNIVSEEDLVPKEWVDGEEGVKLGDYTHSQWDYGRKSGRAIGIGRAADYIMEKAKEAFAKEDDEKAKLYRALSKEVREKVKADDE